MSKKNDKSDRMPDRFSPEFERIFQRAMKLSMRDAYDLITYVGIRFMSYREPGRVASFDEMKDHPKDMLLDPLDEADSRAKVEQFLKDKGV